MAVGDEAAVADEGEAAVADGPKLRTRLQTRLRLLKKVLLRREAESAEASEEAEAAEEGSADGEEDVLSGDVTGLSKEPEASSESVEELVDEGQYYEAEVVDGVENAPPADVAEVTTHERPIVEGESVPDEELPGEQR